ncbi:PucR family transcriptional regulator ligand-binding domain-containing protein [Solirubrobacter sp. CPCC 204708]|uniref:PucR family transcriptional regulator ligand-binding domain-containing protein n=1 Tax=Solirubrobacter deserti TaxID=2282478 RepID=A0ABT4RMA8_9ACTN|nr:PucR family transcriptional regulator [Solirubrobacter deserti]MBE2318016.1 PucR family transcriptional regulator ligand-binding domain-containing protein [Solirubrobacter deserti]MDA0139695.1 PucR family transcriptional regulator ligand-binding domain-containing protein [Solirubrobacter deserti]
MLPLRELLEDLALQVVAGAAGLDRAVRWVHISELADPTPWLSGGELLLTTGLGVGDGREYVERLVAHGLTGLGFGTGFSHERVPPALRETADAHGFPVFEVPYETPFIAITERAASLLVNEQYAVLRRALSAHERLELVVLSERGLDGLAGALAKMIAGPALILDARGELLTSRGRVDPAPIQGELRARLQGGVRRGYAPETLPGGIALPVSRGDGAPEAWLVAAREHGPLNELDRLTLHQAVTLVALELLRRRVIDDTERRLAGDVLSALVSGDLAGAELARRLQPFGLRGRAGVLVLAPARGVRAGVEAMLTVAVRDEVGGGLVAGADAFVCALVPARSDEDLFALARRLLARVEREGGVALPAGAGRCVEAGELRRGFHEARCALEARALAANGGGAEPGLATYRDLGSFQLLLSLQDDDALRLFCDSILGPIEDSEGAYGGELMRSLEAFIECNGQWERAAKALFCHRHTLRYRIRRVEELTGRSLDSARDRIDFWLALRGRELVQPER